VPAGPGEIVRALGADPIPLVVLSACRTAELGRSATDTGLPGRREIDGAADDDRRDADAPREAARSEQKTGPELATPFVRRLAAVIPNVVGWDGSVYDADAIDFAKDFYKQLAGYSPVPRAAAVARHALLRKKGQTPTRGRHWHLARVYIGPQGGAPLCAPAKPKRKWGADSQERVFLDKAKQRVPVATRAEFVGRRRAIQAVLRSFRDGPNGVLIHGMGALGKSSLAARVQNRMPQHFPVVIFERYDALAILDEISDALDPAARRTERLQWRELVKATPSALADALESWLSGPLDTKPILLIVDDLERILETPSQSDAATGIMQTYQEPLAAVLIAFERAQTASRLLLTSRYDFRLPDGRGDDLAAALVRVPLAPMRARERIKQWRAAERVAGRETAELDEAGRALLSRALDAATGNPGLQVVLTRPILTGELDAATEALRQIDVYRATGAPPAEIEALIAAGTAKDSKNALTAFFARVSFATYRSALTPDQARQLAAATGFTMEVPISRRALAAAGAALGVEAPDTAITRLLGLGLLDDWGEMDGVAHAAANPLARPLAPTLEAADRTSLARAALPHLVEAWRDASGDFRPDPRGLEAARIAHEAGAEPAILEDAALAGAAWLERVNGQTRKALALIASTLAAFPSGYEVGPEFLRLGLECANDLGDTELIERLFGTSVRLPTSSDPKVGVSYASFDLRRAEYLRRTGQIAQAEALTREALRIFKAAGNDRMTAIASGSIANILQARGEFNEALKIRYGEELPVFERLGDVHSRAVTMGHIADILLSRGEFDKALRIRREEQLPVFERLGSVRSRAIAMGKIADILEVRGELDEALKIRREEELPVFERLGDVRSLAVTMGRIANILFTRGQFDEALRIRREEELPFYERFGDVHSRAITMGNIADILQARGELDEALRIRREEQLPIYERLGDVRSRSVTLYLIADGLLGAEALEKGRIQEAIDALGESYAIALKLGLPDGIAHAGRLLAQILAIGGNRDDALVVLEEVEAAFQKLGDAKGIAHVQSLREQIRDRSP
jgi:tetratricopeptide (TPR) repeat protein